MKISDLLIIYNFIGLIIAMAGFLSMLMIMKKLNMSEHLKKLSISGYIFFVTPIIVGLTNIYLFLKTISLIPLIIGISILLIEIILRIYDKAKLKQINTLENKREL